VTALVELKARYDEENNIVWARELEQAGVHVVYGIVGLKTHCKAALVVRRERGGLQRYVHLSTGNYNPTTARRLYRLGLFTADPAFGEDVSEMFNLLTGYSQSRRWRKLLVAPSSCASASSRSSTGNAASRGGTPGAHHREDERAGRSVGHRRAVSRSQAGVEIDLIIRGICCLRAGLPGVSERNRVISIVDRFLEHSRVFYFSNGGSPESSWRAPTGCRATSSAHRGHVPVEQAQPSADRRPHPATILGDNVRRAQNPDGVYAGQAGGRTADDPITDRAQQPGAWVPTW